MNDEDRRLLDVYGLLAEIWPDEKSRPSMRALIMWRESGLIPYLRIGRLIYYDPNEVLLSLRKKCTVKAKGKK
jgi:hypothetical protein